ncbi:MAG: zinc-finger domain-containing protein [Paracoccaceae bacterium]|nr:zinc-finger domain-containing protein [Paracoccaceae bacterium]
MTLETSSAHDIPPPETEYVTKTRISCDGGEGALGHPRVWLSIDPKIGWVDCGYCDKRFILKTDG